ncbi:hypothetical protein [Devosia aurantiaca]|uniref:Uncharacterized protein n=1 Tax=Devosia aurantiaca TaxID=2714858 RepID=A0A6M1SPB1_9HYPH|nr:hypothetical protein [Devosia aurantiaca]NGP18386.1 hypothetical protein [Devosia aurantiaca]
MKKYYSLGVAIFAGLTQPAAAASVAEVIGDFPALVGQEVELDCVINRAQAESLYCNTPAARDPLHLR